MERSAIRGRKRSNQRFPDCAEPVIGRAFARPVGLIRATRHPDIRASARIQLREIRDRLPEWFAIDAISSLAGRFSSPSRWMIEGHLRWSITWHCYALHSGKRVPNDPLSLMLSSFFPII